MQRVLLKLFRARKGATIRLVVAASSSIGLPYASLITWMASQALGDAHALRTSVRVAEVRDNERWLAISRELDELRANTRIVSERISVLDVRLARGEVRQ